jgi:hypothetical protein
MTKNDLKNPFKENDIDLVPEDIHKKVGEALNKNFNFKTDF